MGHCQLHRGLYKPRFPFLYEEIQHLTKGLSKVSAYHQGFLHAQAPKRPSALRGIQEGELKPSTGGCEPSWSTGYSCNPQDATADYTR